MIVIHGESDDGHADMRIYMRVGVVGVGVAVVVISIWWLCLFPQSNGYLLDIVIRIRLSVSIACIEMIYLRVEYIIGIIISISVDIPIFFIYSLFQLL